MTVILYTNPVIHDVLIEAGERTWTDVELVTGPSDQDQQIAMGGATYTIMGAAPPLFRFTFASESDAMAFRLRYSDYLGDRPRNPCCDALMALGAE